MTDSIQISASISKACEARAFAAIEAREAAQVVEGQGAQPMAFGIVEQPGQFLGLSLDSVALESPGRGGDFLALRPARHGSPARRPSLEIERDSKR